MLSLEGYAKLTLLCRAWKIRGYVNQNDIIALMAEDWRSIPEEMEID